MKCRREFFLLVCFLVYALFPVSLHAQRWVIDLSTGMDTSGVVLMPLAGMDGRWSVDLPSSGEHFVPLHCGTGAVEGYPPFQGMCQNVRWVSPYMNLAGETLKSAAMGLYTYRMQFGLDGCGILSALLRIHCIGGDNEVLRICINGHAFPVHAGFHAGSNPAWIHDLVISLAPTDLLPGGTNVVTAVVRNDGGPTGFILGGDLELETSGCEPSLAWCSALRLDVQENENRLSWKMSGAPDLELFVVERGDKNERDFVAVGIVKVKRCVGKVTSYEWCDTAAPPAQNSYRLRMVAGNGYWSFSKVVSADNRKWLRNGLAVWANPCFGILHYRVSPSRIVQIEVLDRVGRIVLRLDKEVLPVGREGQLDLSGLGDGAYVIRLQTRTQILEQKFRISRE